MAFRIVIPQTGITPKYVSSGSKSASIAVNNGKPQVVPCTTTCNATVLAPIGTDTFAVSLYDDTTAKGHLLSTGSLTQAVVAGQANTVNISFNGVIASLAISATPNLIPGTTASVPITVTAKDAAGYTIVGTYTTPVSLTNSDTSGDTQLTPSSISDSSTPITLTYNGAGGFPGTNVAAASGPIAATPFAIASLKTTCLNSRTGGAPLGLYPCDVQNAYSLASATTAGTGKTIAIVDAYDDPNAESDLAVYRTEFNLPPCTTANGCFKKVNQIGGTPYPATDPTGGWEGEESLDLDAISAVCPNCKIVLVEANDATSPNMYTAVATAAAMPGVSAVSNSWSGMEYSGEQAEDAYFHHPGIPVVFATGDYDYQAGPQYPDASPYVTAVGGTSLQADSSARGWTETVWNNYPSYGSIDQGTQGGCSLYEPKPAWQHDLGCPNRMTADLSAVGDPYTGTAYYDTFASGTGWSVIGGTSLAAPIIAAVYALSSNTASINDGSYPYTHASQFYDVVSGNDLGVSGIGLSAACVGPTLYFCTAETGYDGPTGIGTPTGAGGIDPLSANGRRAIPARSPDVAARMAKLRGRPTYRLCPPPTTPKVMSCMAIRVDTTGL
ncbi:hypothetical protein EPN42_04925 [bacterium]|nr:MAG: hypothetical protein EPN42_04925 [bacterium]